MRIVESKRSYFSNISRIDCDFLFPSSASVFKRILLQEVYAVSADEKNADQNQHLKGLIETFGKNGAKALDYWLDNSLFSNWTKPPKAFVADEAVIHADFEYYKSLGFTDISTFACYLGADYIELHGEPDITAFAEAYKNLKK